MVAIGEFLASFAHNFIFFSCDVQTTTIAIAITGSLCCSIAFVIFHFFSLLHQGQASLRHPKQSRLIESLHRASQSHASCLSSTKSRSGVMALEVLCVRCEEASSDHLCRYGMCYSCCMGTFQCCVHKSSLAQDHCSALSRRSPGPRHIDLSNRHMRRVPERMGFVGAQLTYLNLSHNDLKGLPPNVGFLHGLRELHLSSNHISELPTTLGTLTHLHHLDLHDNQLSDIPDALLHLSNLTYLNLDQNKFQTLPQNIQKLAPLEELYVRYNSLGSLPDALCNLLNLRVLSVQGNPLQELPAALGSLVRLEQLDASHCQLTAVPPSIGLCVSLSKLLLSFNRLGSLPQELGHLISLEELHLTSNQLRSLPATMEGTNTRLYVSNNPMETEGIDDTCASSVCDGHERGSCFPPLSELAARAIDVHRIKETFLLPKKLQDLLEDKQLCTLCGSPVFCYFSTAMALGRVGWHQYPLRHVYCSPHLPHKCQHAPPQKKDS